VELVKTSRPLAAIFGHSLCTKRTAKICFGGLIAAVFLLQFYYVRELVFMEAVVALGFLVAALIGAPSALGCIAVLWLRKLGSGLKALGALISVRTPAACSSPNRCAVVRQIVVYHVKRISFSLAEVLRFGVVCLNADSSIAKMLAENVDFA